MSIKAIETKYKGYRFRSRLEARWAVFLDAMNIRWVYEHEGYQLPGGIYYLPDFWLPDLKYFLEIKPRESGYTWFSSPQTNAFMEAERNGQTPGDLYVICGSPLPPPDGVDWYSDDSPYVCYVSGDYPYIWCECPYCGAVGMQFDARSARNTHREGCIAHSIGNGDKNYCHNSPRLMSAYHAATSARFEHGETP